MSSQREDLVRQVGLGAISGLRSMSGPAFVARAARGGGIPLQETRLSLFSSTWAGRVLTVLQAGEMVADKLPFTPGRTGPGPLLGRAGSGALVGSAVAASGDHRVWAGALVGAGSALVAAFAGERLRALIAQKTGAPDLLLGVLEDGVGLAVGHDLAGHSAR